MGKIRCKVIFLFTDQSSKEMAKNWNVAMNHLIPYPSSCISTVIEKPENRKSSRKKSVNHNVDHSIDHEVPIIIPITSFNLCDPNESSQFNSSAVYFDSNHLNKVVKYLTNKKECATQTSLQPTKHEESAQTEHGEFANVDSSHDEVFKNNQLLKSQIDSFRYVIEEMSKERSATNLRIFSDQKLLKGKSLQIEELISEKEKILAINDELKLSLKSIENFASEYQKSLTAKVQENEHLKQIFNESKKGKSVLLDQVEFYKKTISNQEKLINELQSFKSAHETEKNIFVLRLNDNEEGKKSQTEMYANMNQIFIEKLKSHVCKMRQDLNAIKSELNFNSILSDVTIHHRKLIQTFANTFDSFDEHYKNKFHIERQKCKNCEGVITFDHNEDFKNFDSADHNQNLKTDLQNERSIEEGEKIDAFLQNGISLNEESNAEQSENQQRNYLQQNHVLKQLVDENQSRIIDQNMMIQRYQTELEELNKKLVSLTIDHQCQAQMIQTKTSENVALVDKLKFNEDGIQVLHSNLQAIGEKCHELVANDRSNDEPAIVSFEQTLADLNNLQRILSDKDNLIEAQNDRLAKLSFQLGQSDEKKFTKFQSLKQPFDEHKQQILSSDQAANKVEHFCFVHKNLANLFKQKTKITRLDRISKKLNKKLSRKKLRIKQNQRPQTHNSDTENPVSLAQSTAYLNVCSNDNIPRTGVITVPRHSTTQSNQSSQEAFDSTISTNDFIIKMLDQSECYASGQLQKLSFFSFNLCVIVLFPW